ncbi:MAG: hypothetical protein COA42_04805 [Alteromonadaceae bacterium]|nr:MAG: hypothetical protein COA42_04805 [Alteromonadaceae bacterium]
MTINTPWGIRLLAAAMGLGLSACSTMEFVNGPKMEETVIREHWHHLAIGGLIELSEPMDISYQCDDKQWDSITIEKSIFNAFTGIGSPYGIPLYAPWTIIYECREPID